MKTQLQIEHEDRLQKRCVLKGLVRTAADFIRLNYLHISHSAAVSRQHSLSQVFSYTSYIKLGIYCCFDLCFFSPFSVNLPTLLFILVLFFHICLLFILHLYLFVNVGNYARSSENPQVYGVVLKTAQVLKCVFILRLRS